MFGRSLSLGRLFSIVTAWVCFIQYADAQTLDPHKVFEQRCGGCHTAHAGDFVGDYLVRSEGKLLTRKSSRELRSFLDSGHGKLAPGEVDVLVIHFDSILKSGGLFQEKCRVCHDRAVELAWHNLILRDGKLMGRYSGRDIAEFLKDHGRLEQEEIEKMISVLKRQLL